MDKFTFVISQSGDAAAVYDADGKRVDAGHVTDVMERFIEKHTRVEYVEDIVGDPGERGWNGVASTLSALGLEA